MAATGADPRLERLSFFSDAVFAIAITLLIIEIHVPHVAPMTDRGFLAALAGLIPAFAGFTVSFFVIGAFWAGHHRSFACAATWDQRVVFPNSLMLFAVAAMPFFTAFSSAYSVHRVPVALYCGWLVLTALLNLRLQRVLTTEPMVAVGVTAAQIGYMRQRAWAVMLGGTTAFATALVFPPAALPMLATIPLWRPLLTKLADRRSRAEA